MNVVEADLTWLNGRFQPHIKIQVASDGTIGDVGDLTMATTTRLAKRAILPGFVNAHSHAFQRALRGSGEQFPRGAGSFWTWREAMYTLVEEVEPARFLTICKRVFVEMLNSGITTVGEFHYLHHNRDRKDFAFDRLILEAAHAVGIRIVLLNTYYETGGIHQELSQAQQRFATRSPEFFWENIDRLGNELHSPRQTIGIAAHSIRAVPLATIVGLHAESTQRGLPFHMHVEEQRQEIEVCQQAYGATPMHLLNRELHSNGNFTAVHCTHSTPEDLEVFTDAQRGMCLCPLTEANLGDGIPNAEAVDTRNKVCLGTDSNARISMLEEMRWLEYGQRLRYEHRGSIAHEDGDVAKRLIAAAASGGAQALNVRTGTIQKGHFADLISIDLEHPMLEFTTPDTLAAGLVFGCGAEVIDGVYVGGEWIDRRRGDALD